jgi:superfamily I DNA and/or RNA helicase
MFFDVSGGWEDSGRQGSMRNSAEARFIAAMVLQLHAMTDGAEATPPSCAVVTPYKEQKACIADELRRVLGAHRSAAVRVGTVDSFQVCSLLTPLCGTSPLALFSVIDRLRFVAEDSEL